MTERPENQAAEGGGVLVAGERDRRISSRVPREKISLGEAH